MKIKYVGPRPEISYRGIDFKVGKDDKYVYLPYAINVLQELDKPHVDKHVVHLETFHKTTEDEIFETIKKYEPDIDEHIQEEIERFTKHLDEEMQDVKDSIRLTDEEKKIFINNLMIMRNYRLQRAVNKIAYMHTIEHIINVIKRERIEVLDTPFCERFWHIHESIRGHVFSLRSSVKSEFSLVDEKKENKLFARLNFLY